MAQSSQRRWFEQRFIQRYVSAADVSSIGLISNDILNGPHLPRSFLAALIIPRRKGVRWIINLLRTRYRKHELGPTDPENSQAIPHSDTHEDNRVNSQLHRAAFPFIHGDSLYSASMNGKGTAQYRQAIPVDVRDNDGKQPP